MCRVDTKRSVMNRCSMLDQRHLCWPHARGLGLTVGREGGSKSQARTYMSRTSTGALASLQPASRLETGGDAVGGWQAGCFPKNRKHANKRHTGKWSCSGAVSWFLTWFPDRFDVVSRSWRFAVGPGIGKWPLCTTSVNIAQKRTKENLIAMYLAMKGAGEQFSSACRVP